MKNWSKVWILTCILLLTIGCVSNLSQDNKIFKGAYLGQKEPGDSACLFAPGFISNGLNNRDFIISPNGDELFVTVYTPNFQYATLLYSQMIDGIWQPLEVPDFASNPNYKFIEPAFNADGTELFFMSTQPRDSSTNPMDEDIWKVEKIDGIWTNVQNIGYPVCTDKSEYFPSLTHDGTLYFTRHEKDEGADVIYRSRLLNGKYQEPERLPKQINCGSDRFNAFVSPDESYVIVPAVGVEPGIRTVQYYITFHNADDTWGEPVNMGPEINLPRGNGWSMNLSPDGKYLFFMSSRSDENSVIPAKLSYQFFHDLAQQAGNGSADIYWINASVLSFLAK